MVDPGRVRLSTSCPNPERGCRVFYCLDEGITVGELEKRVAVYAEESAREGYS